MTKLLPHYEQNPWTTISSKEIYKNPWINIREDLVIRPDGKEGIYGVVSTRIATGVVALTPERHIYLVGQYRYPTNRYSWEIIEGGSDTGETAIEAARRELREEAGLIAHTWEPIGDVVFLSNCFSSEEAFFFLATDLAQTEHERDGTELLEITTVPLAQAISMVISGEITDSMSVIALLKIASDPKYRSLL